MERFTPETFKAILPLICDRQTSADPANWTEKNPLWGHCAVVSLVAQDIFEGELLRASLEDVPEFADMRSHYINKLPDGKQIDFTAPQFGKNYPGNLVFKTRDRSYVLSNPNTVLRYCLLAERLTAFIRNNA